MANRRGIALTFAVAFGVASALASAHTQAALACAALALLLVGAVAWDPTWAAVLLFAFLPFRTLVNATVPLPLRFVTDVVVLVLAVRVVARHPETVFPLDAVEAFGLLFLLVGLAATVHAHASLAAAALEGRDLLLFWLLYAALRRLRAAGDGPTRQAWDSAVRVGLAAIALVGIQGLLGLMSGHPHTFLIPGPWLHEPITPVNRGRPYGWVNNPNVFGELGFMGLALSHHQLRLRRLPAPLGIGLAALFLAMVLFSYSRTAWIITFVGIAVYVIASRSFRERLSLLAAAALVTLGIVALPRAHYRAVTVASRSTILHSRHVGRLATLAMAGKIIRRRPFGTGMGTFGSGASKVFHQTVQGIPHAFYGDDNYAVLLVETGILGFILFLLMGLMVYRTIWRSHAPPADRLLVFVLFLALTLVAGTANAWEQLNLTLYPWLALGWLVAASQVGPRVPRLDRLPGVPR